MSLVIKEWLVRKTPNDHGICVRIRGRQPGLLSFLLSLVGVDPTTTIYVTRTEIVFEQGSLSGFAKRVIPLHNVCSVYYGYVKPWKEALTLAIFLGPVTLGLGLFYALYVYWVGQELDLGFVENSGFASGISFKRSVIEGMSIDEDEAQRVIEVISKLIRDAGGQPAGHHPSPPRLSEKPLCAGCGEVLAAGGQYCESCGRPVA